MSPPRCALPFAANAEISPSADQIKQNPPQPCATRSISSSTTEFPEEHHLHRGSQSFEKPQRDRIAISRSLLVSLPAVLVVDAVDEVFVSRCFRAWSDKSVLASLSLDLDERLGLFASRLASRFRSFEIILGNVLGRHLCLLLVDLAGFRTLTRTAGATLPDILIALALLLYLLVVLALLLGRLLRLLAFA